MDYCKSPPLVFGGSWVRLSLVLWNKKGKTENEGRILLRKCGNWLMVTLMKIFSAILWDASNVDFLSHCGFPVCNDGFYSTHRFHNALCILHRPCPPLLRLQNTLPLDCTCAPKGNHGTSSMGLIRSWLTHGPPGQKSIQHNEQGTTSSKLILI